MSVGRRCIPFSTNAVTERVRQATGFTREYTERFTRDLLVERLRESIDDTRIATFVDLGAHLTEDQAFRLVQRKPTTKGVY